MTATVECDAPGCTTWAVPMAGDASAWRCRAHRGVPAPARTACPLCGDETAVDVLGAHYVLAHHRSSSEAPQ